MANAAEEPPSAPLDSAGPAQAPTLAVPDLHGLHGEMVPSPRSRTATAILGVTGILALLHIARLLGRWVLLVKRPAELRLTAGTIAICTRTELLGRVLRERDIVIPRTGLVRATRETKYPGAPLYAGLFALAIGSYLGVALVVDGLRAASASMLGVGLLVAALGIGIDFALTSLVPSLSGRCRLVLVPRRGPVVSVGLANPRDADELLAALRQTTS